MNQTPAVPDRQPAARPRLTAYSLVLAPALAAAGNFLAGHEASTTAGVLGDVAAAPHRFFASRILFYAGMLLLLPGVITLLRLVPARGRQWATVGGILTGIGAAGYGGGEFMLGYANPLLTDPSIDRTQAIAAMNHLQADALGAVPFLIGLFAYVGPAIVGVGVVRARVLPRVMGAALVVMPLVWFAMAAGSYRVGAVGSLLLVVTYGFVVRETLGGGSVSDAVPVVRHADAQPAG